MTRVRYALLALLVAAAAAIVVVGLSANDRHASTAGTLPKGKALAATANLFPQSLLFGQPVHVRIDAVVDRAKLDPNAVRVDANWSPYTPIAPMRQVRSDVGAYTRLRWLVDLHCIQLPCVPRVGSAVRNVFQPTILRAGSSAAAQSVTVTWPNVIAWSRLDVIDQERKAVVQKTGSVVRRQVAAFAPPWHVNTSAIAASYRIGPRSVFWGALALALALVVAATAVVRPYLPVPAWLAGRREPSTLERALDAVDRARGRPVEERKALELLAAELRTSGESTLAWAASELAWSPDAPEPDRTGDLTTSIRRELTGRTNGHRG